MGGFMKQYRENLQIVQTENAPDRKTNEELRAQSEDLYLETKIPNISGEFEMFGNFLSDRFEALAKTIRKK